MTEVLPTVARSDSGPHAVGKDRLIQIVRTHDQTPSLSPFHGNPRLTHSSELNPTTGGGIVDASAVEPSRMTILHRGSSTPVAVWKIESEGSTEGDAQEHQSPCGPPRGIQNSAGHPRGAPQGIHSWPCHPRGGPRGTHAPTQPFAVIDPLATNAAIDPEASNTGCWVMCWARWPPPFLPLRSDRDIETERTSI